MPRTTRIHKGKATTFRRHFLREWLEERGMEPMDLVHALNESEPDHFIDKTQIYRWLRGQLPHAKTQVRIAAALSLTDPETGEPTPERLMHHPAHDWIARKFQGRDMEEIERIRRMVDIAFPDKTGTDG